MSICPGNDLRFRFDARVDGESSGDAHTAQLTLSPAFGTVTLTLDGKADRVQQENNLLTFDLPAGNHTFEIVNGK